MTSPYTPEFEFTDWPNGPLQANVPAANSPNVVLHRVEAEFGNVAAAFTELGGLRGAVNALLEGRVPTTSDLPVSVSSDNDWLNRAALLDAGGGLVVVWKRLVTEGDFTWPHVYAARLDPARPQDGFAPAVAVTSGRSGAGNEPTAVALPDGGLIVAYPVSAAGGTSDVVMKRAPLAGLPAAGTQPVIAATGVVEQYPFAVLAGSRVVFIGYRESPNQWMYRRYDHAAATFVDGAPAALGPATATTLHYRSLHAAASGSVVWAAFIEGTTLHGRRLDAAGGAVTGPAAPVQIGGQAFRVFVLPIGDTEATVFLDTETDLRVFSLTAAGWGAPVVVPGTVGGDHDPAAVRDADGTVYLFYTRQVTSTRRAVLLRRRSPVTGDWGPPMQVTRHLANEGEPLPVLVPGQGLWLVYASNRTGDLDLYATRIITAV